MRGSRKFCQSGSNFDSFFVVVDFLVDEGKVGSNTTKSEPSLAPSAKHHLNGVSLACQ